MDYLQIHKELARIRNLLEYRNCRNTEIAGKYTPNHMSADWANA